jgi:aminoglycoside phosphotransferase (APT) family kinase protein
MLHRSPGSITDAGRRPPSDRPLDAAIALAAVREQLPALACERAEHLGSGWGSDVYRLDDGLVARFPRTAAAAEWVDAEHAVLGLVASSLASAFAVPRVVGRGRAGTHFPDDFLVCTLVRGISAAPAPRPVRDELAEDLGRALTRIHAVPVEDARAAGLREVEWDDSGYAGPPRLLHGDFRAGNVVVDPASGRLAGVIDWGNAAVGDPALDFMTLVIWRGWAFMRRALDAYALPVDDGFLDRVRYHARLQALQALRALADAVRRRADPALHLEWVCNAFSLVPAPAPADPTGPVSAPARTR